MLPTRLRNTLISWPSKLFPFKASTDCRLLNMAPSCPTAETTNGRNWRSNLVKSLYSLRLWTRRTHILHLLKYLHVFHIFGITLMNRDGESKSGPGECGHRLLIYGRAEAPSFYRSTSKATSRRSWGSSGTLGSTVVNIAFAGYNISNLIFLRSHCMGK
jgi:hypothetical protein